MFMSEVIKLSKKPLKFKAYVADDLITKTPNENSKDNLHSLLQNQYSNGFEDGKQSVKISLEEKYSKDLEKKYDIFKQFLSKINQQLMQYEIDFESLVLSVSHLIAEKVLRREIEKETIIQSVLEESIKKVLGANELIIRINPSDFQIINSDTKKEFSQDMFSKIRFEPDERIEQGGCFVESEIGSADGRISSQLTELKRKLDSNPNRNSF